MINFSRVHRLFSAQKIAASRARKTPSPKNQPRAANSSKQTHKKAYVRKREEKSIIISAHRLRTCVVDEALCLRAAPPSNQHAIRSPPYICILITAGHDKSHDERERQSGRMGRRTHSQVHINPIAQFCVHGTPRRPGHQWKQTHRERKRKRSFVAALNNLPARVLFTGRSYEITPR